MVAFFLHRLVKLLQDGHDDVIEWSTEGDLHVYSSKRLEADILPNYYGHAKFTSFLRQLTSYGFSRILNNTKSRLPLDCCYKNEETTKDVNSLLKLKKKTAPNPSAKRMHSLQKKETQEKRVCTCIHRKQHRYTNEQPSATSTKETYYQHSNFAIEFKHKR